MAKKRSEYFQVFVNQAELACEAAEYLGTVLKNFERDTLHVKLVHMHDIENRADSVKHEAMRKLSKEFVTPIEREDIVQIFNEFDEVIDLIDDVLIRIDMYNIKQILPDALLFADVIYRSCVALVTAAKEFGNFQKGDILHKAIIDVNTMEEEGDAIYIDAMRNLFKNPTDPIEVVAWNETFDKLEECCDACEHVSDIMESVIMKNS